MQQPSPEPEMTKSSLSSRRRRRGGRGRGGRGTGLQVASPSSEPTGFGERLERLASQDRDEVLRMLSNAEWKLWTPQLPAGVQELELAWIAVQNKRAYYRHCEEVGDARRRREQLESASLPCVC